MLKCLKETVKLIFALIAFPQPENSYGFEVNSKKLNIKQDDSFHESVIVFSIRELSHNIARKCQLFNNSTLVIRKIPAIQAKYD